MVPDSATKLCSLIGDPVEHSISPLLHNSAFEYSGLNYIYLVFKVSRTGLGRAIAGLRELGFVGANITMPHKEGIIPLLDDLDDTARRVGAVNTVVNDGGLRGYNTDVEGFAAPLRKRVSSFEGIKAVVIGAGGAARAVVTALADGGCRDFVLMNRTESRTEGLAAKMREMGVNVGVKNLGQESLASVGRFDLIVNATPLGSQTSQIISIFDNLPAEGAIAYDLVYRPRETPFLRAMRKSGASVIYGYEMLVEQAALSFSIWTGKTPNRDVMSSMALKALEEKSG